MSINADEIRELSSLLDAVPGGDWEPIRSRDEVRKSFEGESGTMTVKVRPKGGQYVATIDYHVSHDMTLSATSPAPADDPEEAVKRSMVVLAGKAEKSLREAFNLASGAGFDVSLDAIERDL